MARLDSSFCPELNESIVAKLHSQNIFTVYDFMLQSYDDLMKKFNLTFKQIENIKETFFKNFGGKIVNPLGRYEQELKNKISTGLMNLDTILEGGLHCGRIYEICGSSSAGKSQLCHWISTSATLNSSAEVYYIDASRNFYASRIQMILETRQCGDHIIGKVMSSIKVYRIYKFCELFTLFHRLTRMPSQGEATTKRLVIVDSLSVLCALVSNTEINPILNNFASVCRYLINNFPAAVVTVNAVRSKSEVAQLAGVEAAIEKKFDLNLKPALGKYWLCVPNVRLLITSLENKRREIAVWNSCRLKDGNSCLVDIRDGGIFQCS